MAEWNDHRPVTTYVTELRKAADRLTAERDGQLALEILRALITEDGGYVNTGPDWVTVDCCGIPVTGEQLELVRRLLEES